MGKEVSGTIREMTTATESSIADLIQQARDLNYTVARIAAVCETTQGTVFNWATGQRPQRYEFVRDAIQQLIDDYRPPSSENDLVRLRSLIRGLRDKGVRLIDIADHLETSRLSVHNWETGVSTPRNIADKNAKLRDLLSKS